MWPRITILAFADRRRTDLPLSALRQGAAVPGLHPEAALRGMRARFRLRGCATDRRCSVILFAGFVVVGLALIVEFSTSRRSGCTRCCGAADPAGHARAAAVQGRADRPAISPRCGGRPARPRGRSVTQAAGHRRRLLLPTLAALVALAVLCRPRHRQIERKAWKEGLIATLTERCRTGDRSAATRLMGPPDGRDRRVSPCRAPGGASEQPGGLVYGRLGPAAMSRVPATGCSRRRGWPTAALWWSTAASCPKGAARRRAAPRGRSRARSRSSVRYAGRSARPVHPGRRSGTQSLVRARPRRHGGRQGPGPVAPFFIDQEAPEPPGGLPRPGRIRSNLPNNHLQYALTWYGLALVLVVVFVVWARGRTSERMDA